MEVVKSYAADLLGRQEVQILVDNLRATHPVVVDELLPNIMTIGEVQKIMQNLLKERISVVGVGEDRLIAGPLDGV